MCIQSTSCNRKVGLSNSGEKIDFILIIIINNFNYDRNRIKVNEYMVNKRYEIIALKNVWRQKKN